MDTSLPFLLLEKCHLLKLWDIGWKHIRCCLCISCSIFSVFVRHSKQYSTHYCLSVFLELKLSSFCLYREEEAKMNSFLRSLGVYLSPAPSQTSPRNVKLLPGKRLSEWINQSEPQELLPVLLFLFWQPVYSSTLALSLPWLLPKGTRSLSTSTIPLATIILSGLLTNDTPEYWNWDINEEGCTVPVHQMLKRKIAFNHETL